MSPVAVDPGEGYRGVVGLHEIRRGGIALCSYEPNVRSQGHGVSGVHNGITTTEHHWVVQEEGSSYGSQECLSQILWGP